MTCCTRRHVNMGKIIGLLSSMSCPHHYYQRHTPYPDLEREADPAWSYRSRWIFQICLLGLMEMLSGKCNDLCGFVCVYVCVPTPQSTVPITLSPSGENSLALLRQKGRTEPVITSPLRDRREGTFVSPSHKKRNNSVYFVGWNDKLPTTMGCQDDRVEKLL